MDVEKDKQCAQCKQVHPKTSYYKNKATRDGLDNYCKSCRSLRDRGLFPTKKDELNGRSLKMEDFYPPEKQWKRLETWNKFDATRLDELLYNGGDINEAFHMKVHDRIAYEKSRKKKRRWGQ